VTLSKERGRVSEVDVQPVSHSWRGLLKATLPAPLGAVAKAIAQTLTQQHQRSVKEEAARTQHALNLTRSEIIHGSFKGMRYVTKSKGSPIAPKLLGTYEKELFPIWDEVFRRHYSTLINIGAGEGYYAVGLARRMPELRVIAFEAAADSRELIAELARLNSVDRVTIMGSCDVAALALALGDGKATLLICDVEGSENDLLRPSLLGALRNVDILVESHDYLRPGITAELVRRFEPTHRIRLVPSCPRALDDWPEGVSADATSVECKLALLSERRPGPMAWLWMETDDPSSLQGPSAGTENRKGW
jgi:hypothetical protein